MSIAGEQARRGVAVTIAYGDTATATQAIFTGTVEDVRGDLAAFFGLDKTSVSALCASDVVVNATQAAHAKAAVAHGLGGTIIESYGERAPQRSGPAGRTLKAVAPTGSSSPAGEVTSPWIVAAQQDHATGSQDAAREPHPLLAAIERAASVPELQQIWARNQEAFSVPEVAAAWKAKGRALHQAA